jgi:beta-lactamase regulating signal transducer with metallopeptidase domain
MTAFELLHGPLGSTLGWTLVHLLWQATAVAILLGAVRTLWPAASPDARYLTSLAALMAILLLPVLTFMHLSAGQPSFSPAVTGSLSVPAVQAWTVSTLPESGNPALTARVETFVSSRLPWFVGFWVVGVLLLGTRLVLRTAWTTRLTRDGLTEVEGSWHRAVDRLRKKLDLTRTVRLYESALVQVPTVVGWLKPVILVPTSVFLGLTYRQIEAILAHELAHVRRHDALVNLLQSVVETLFFYHPAVWWISGRIRIEREHCCDDMALRVCHDRVAFARALTFLEETRAEIHQGALAASGGSLLRRIRRIAGVEERDRKAPSIAALIILLMLGSATVWALAAPDREVTPDYEVAVRAEEREDGSRTRLAPSSTAEEATRYGSSSIIEIDDHGFSVPAPPPPPLPAIAPPDPPAPPAPPDVAYFELEHPQAPPAPPAPPRVVAGAAPPAPAPAPRVRSRAPRASDRRLSEELTIDDLILLRGAGVTPDYVKELRALGFDDLTVRQAVHLRGAGVSPDYIRTMRSIFGSDLSVDVVAQLRGVGVSPEWLTEMTRHTGRTISVNDAIRLRGVGVTPDYIQGMAAAGIDARNLDELIHLRGVGVNPDYVRGMREAGVSPLDARNLTQLRGVGVTPDYVRQLHDAGLRNLDAEKLIRLRGAGVDPDFIRQMRSD